MAVARIVNNLINMQNKYGLTIDLTHSWDNATGFGTPWLLR
jgi:hypothetical protein